MQYIYIFFPRCGQLLADKDQPQRSVRHGPSAGGCHITVTLTLTAIVTLFLGFALAVVVAESTLPKAIKRLSYMLVHDRQKRNAVIIVTFCFMCVATALAVVSKT